MSTCIQDFPNELFLLIFPQLPLKGLIAAQGTCRKWRTLVSASFVHPSRRRLLELYMKCLESSAFHHARRHIIPHLHSSDREQYATRLPENTPDEVKLWLTEWPSKATVSWIWPGLPRSAPSTVEPSLVSVSSRGLNLLDSNKAFATRRFSLVNPDADLALMPWDTLCHPVMFPAPKTWSELAADHVDVTVLPLAQFQTTFRYVTSPLYLVLDAGKGADSLKGTLWYFEMGDKGRVAGDCIEFLEEELKRQGREMSGER